LLLPVFLLADFDEVAVRVTHVAAQFVIPVAGWCQELGPACTSLIVDGAYVGDSNVEEAADVIAVSRWFEPSRSACQQWVRRRR
jgi:hypothetical protein